MNSESVEGTVRNFTGKAKDGLGGLTGDAKLQTEGKIDQLAGQGQSLYGDAKEALENGAEQAQSMADAASQVVGDAARRARAQASDMGERVSAQASDLGRYASERVQEQPLAALALAGLVGGLIGALLASARR